MVVLTEGLRRRDIGRRMVARYVSIVPKTLEQEDLYLRVLEAREVYDRAVARAGGPITMFSEGQENAHRIWFANRAEKINADPFCQRAKKELDQAQKSYMESLAA